jgi:hypothetical protein
MMDRLVGLGAISAVLVAACGKQAADKPQGEQSASPPVATPHQGTITTITPAPIGSPTRVTPVCAPLASLAENCPAVWSAVNADKVAFCANRPTPSVDALVSTHACRGWLRYTRHLSSYGGSRYCLFDPNTKKLAGYRAFDGKAEYEAWSCGFDKANFDDKECTGTPC